MEDFNYSVVLYTNDYVNNVKCELVILVLRVLTDKIRRTLYFLVTFIRII